MGSGNCHFLAGRFLLNLDNQNITVCKSFCSGEHLLFGSRDWVEAVKFHDLEILAFQLILLTAGGIITTFQVPWTFAKRLLTRLAKNLSSVWTKYLVSIGNSCLCG